MFGCYQVCRMNVLSGSILLTLNGDMGFGIVGSVLSWANNVKLITALERILEHL